MVDPKQLHSAALWYIEKHGISVFPLLPNDKRPACEWGHFNTTLATQEQVESWSKCNLGLATGKLSGLAVIDCESRTDAEWFVANRSDTPVVSQTKRGYHLWFRCPEGCEIRNGAKVKDETGRPRYDVRGEGGYIVCPPSVVDGWAYQFCFGRRLVSVQALPEFRPEWCPSHPAREWPDKKWIDAVAYIGCIRAVSGNGGHPDTWRAVNILRESGMTEVEALATMVEWNQTNADPPWSMGELLHKVKDCYGR